MSFDQLCDLLRRTWQVQGLTASTAHKRLALLRSVGGLDANYDSIMDYLAGISNQNTRRVSVSYLRTTFKTLLALGLIEHDPMVLVPRTKHVAWKPDALTPAEVDMLTAQLPDPVQQYFILGLYAGLRASEIATLDACALVQSFGGPMLRIVGKGGVDKSIPAHPKVIALLDGKKGRVFPNATAKLVSQRSQRAFERLGVEGGIHRARHTFALRVLQASDGDLLVVRDLLRHASVATVQHYVGCLPGVSRKVLESIA